MFQGEAVARTAPFSKSAAWVAVLCFAGPKSTHTRTNKVREVWSVDPAVSLVTLVTVERLSRAREREREGERENYIHAQQQ